MKKTTVTNDPQNNAYRELITQITVMLTINARQPSSPENMNGLGA